MLKISITERKVKGIKMWGMTYSGHRKLKIGRPGFVAILICIAVIVLIIISAVNAPEEAAVQTAPDDSDRGVTIAEYINAYGNTDSSVTVSRDAD